MCAVRRAGGPRRGGRSTPSRPLAAYLPDELAKAGLPATSYRRLGGRTGPGSGARRCSAPGRAELVVSMPRRDNELLAESVERDPADMARPHLPKRHMRRAANSLHLASSSQSCGRAAISLSWATTAAWPWGNPPVRQLGACAPRDCRRGRSLPRHRLAGHQGTRHHDPAAVAPLHRPPRGLSYPPARRPVPHASLSGESAQNVGQDAPMPVVANQLVLASQAVRTVAGLRPCPSMRTLDRPAAWVAVPWWTDAPALRIRMMA
jgi:hypothetical protein